MSTSAMSSGVVINNQQTVTVYDLDEDTDSLAEDEDQDTASGLDDEHEETDPTSVERATVLPAATKLAVEKNDDDDFRPVKKRKVQESNESAEVDEVMKMNVMQWSIPC